MAKHWTKLIIIAFLATGMQSVYAQYKPLEGYVYDTPRYYSNKEWEDPEFLALNKEQPHAWFFDFASKDEAREVLPYNSRYWKSLNGTWKFHWVPNPDERPDSISFHRMPEDWDDITVPGCWNVQGIQKDGSLKYGVPIYCNQPVIFQHKVEVGDWRGGVMREPKEDWTTYKHRNEVGTYMRSFTVPTNWEGKEVYINFDGVNSFFYLFINGRYIGFSKNSRTTAQFDITPYLNPEGENILAVEVFRNSDGSFLEAQDMWRLPGIYRSVSLTAKSKVQARDIIVRTTDEKAGTVHVEAYLKNLLPKKQQNLSLSYSVYQCKLYEDENSPVEGLQNITQAVGSIDTQNEAYITTDITIPDARLWSSEAPHRYVLVGELKDKNGNALETFSTYFGVRKVEIRDTPASEDEFGLAGRYYYINGKPVKLKGVNRQEINLATGNTITHEQILDEIMLMHRGNINHVRTSHYSNDPFWFYACDKYGIYLEDEANIESHEYYYGEASLSHVPEFRNAHIARVMESAHAHVNAPSIVIWSLGNEAGPGKNFVDAYAALHEFDATRPVQYERNNDIVDMGSNQYPSIGWMREAVKGEMKDIKYPFHISEYAHSMGNAGGNLEDYWEAIESTNFFCGGAIWDWVDQALWNYTKDGTRYMAYGGDFGDKPNSGTFCMNGILYPDHTPKAEFEEVKKVYQYYGVRMLDERNGTIEVFNKNYFSPMKDVEMTWTLYKDGVQQGDVHHEFVGAKNILGPRQKQQYRIPYDYDSLDKESEYYVRVQFRLAKDMPWAKKGFIQAEEELYVKSRQMVIGIVYAKIKYKKSKDEVAVTGDAFSVKFDNQTGTISSLIYDGKEYITPGNGPQFNGYRAPVDNDNWGGARTSWNNDGLQRMECKATSKPIVKKTLFGISIKYDVEYQAVEDFVIHAKQCWLVHYDGSVELQSGIYSNEPDHYMARLGYALKLDKSLGEYTYYGRGPRNNYNDRCSGSFHGIYHSTVAEQFEPFPRPQDMANREDMKWCSLTDASGNGLQFVLESKGAGSCLPYSDVALAEAEHPYQLPESDGTYLHLDAKVNGLGGNSCGQGGPLMEDRVKATATNFAFMIRPVRGDNDESLTTRSMVNFSQEKPSVTDPIIKKAPLKVVYASSIEPDWGEAENLVDGDPESTWITAYGVTVAQFPHWVDFDAGEQQLIKGISYLPIADGDYANVKHYQIFVSNDGQNWGEAIVDGEFPKGKYNKQKVFFPAPVKARYIRFYCLSSQNARDYAGGSEFGIIVE